MNLSGNNFQEFPKELCFASELEVLNLSNNKLTEVLHSFENLYNLRTLNLSQNLFKVFPEVLASLKKVNYSSFKYWRTTLHSLENLKQVVEIDLSNNDIESTPKDLSSLKQLRELNLNYNSFLKLPVSLTKLMHLRSLNLEGNSLEKIPYEIRDVRKKVFYYIYL